jgi:hypothetical protein
MTGMKKTITILLSFFFVVLLTAGAVNAISPRPEPPSKLIHYELVKSTDIRTLNTANQQWIEKAPETAFKVERGLITTKVNMIGLIHD